DVKKQVVERLNGGEIHIEEPGVQAAIEQVIATGQCEASTKAEEADAYIIAVPTPNKEDEFKSCDISIVMSGVESIIPLLKKGDTVIVESTIAPRTMDDHVAPYLEEQGFKIGEDIYLVHCPERVLQGRIMEAQIDNKRSLGGMSPACVEAGKKVYGSFMRGGMIETKAKTAEMSKLMEDTYRDVNIALANELASICNHLDINVHEVIE